MFVYNVRYDLIGIVINDLVLVEEPNIYHVMSDDWISLD
jgi:hypothetical protein